MPDSKQEEILNRFHRIMEILYRARLSGYREKSSIEVNGVTINILPGGWVNINELFTALNKEFSCGLSTLKRDLNYLSVYLDRSGQVVALKSGTPAPQFLPLAINLPDKKTQVLKFLILREIFATRGKRITVPELIEKIRATGGWWDEAPEALERLLHRHLQQLVKSGYLEELKNNDDSVKVYRLRRQAAAEVYLTPGELKDLLLHLEARTADFPFAEQLISTIAALVRDVDFEQAAGYLYRRHRLIYVNSSYMLLPGQEEIITVLEKAAREGHKVEITYQQKDRQQKLIIKPASVIWHARKYKWYVYHYLPGGKVHALLLEKITDYRLLREPLTPHPSPAAPESETCAWEISRDQRQEVELLIRPTPLNPTAVEKAQHILRARYPQVTFTRMSEGLKATFTVSGISEFLTWLRSQADAVEVIRPASLRRLLARSGRRMLKRYGVDSG